ncbi:HAD family hydrolase [Frateuria terrea]|uniref:Putative hydrolase of the HAD superfamily n=1 Tax=Frateuria terrea TaxID=529704 RepID=A0A1H6ZZH6_9GAMM|nr:HAD family hydrolase [Frateuria terrea]SEJ57594.1 putative hydrolase of the HAD superfamily [Frateuria terrea]SFP65922.1 putative hydrolase of the HAD superfamily [Frateuria terrea]
MRILALTLDLDDTLWPVLPALECADREVDDWLRRHHPEVATRWPIPAMRQLRAQIAAERLDLAHDFTTQRQLTMQRAFDACGLGEAPVEALWEVYFAARNRVELYADALPALERITARWPVASLTNGNADLERIGIHTHFHCHVCARDTGVGKPDARIFREAVQRLGVAPEHILHVGDDPGLDVCGARDAGLRTAWINRDGLPWPRELGTPPDLDLPDMEALADWLEQSQGGL